MKEKLLFQDEKNKQGSEIIASLKQWCSTQECESCGFANDNDGSCQIAENVPSELDLDEIYENATFEYKDSDRYKVV